MINTIELDVKYQKHEYIYKILKNSLLPQSESKCHYVEQQKKHQIFAENLLKRDELIAAGSCINSQNMSPFYKRK